MSVSIDILGVKIKKISQNGFSNDNIPLQIKKSKRPQTNISAALFLMFHSKFKEYSLYVLKKYYKSD